jgi:hypothetical protein
MAFSLGMILTGYAQKDSIPETKKDTIRIGGILIITKKDRKNKPREVDIRNESDSGKKTVKYKGKPKKRSNVSTNLLSWDIGFNNYKDETNYSSPDVTSLLRATPRTTAPGASDFKLNTGKSVNVNIWLFTQKLNLVKHVLGLKYGLGLEYYNFRFKTPLSFKDASPSYIIKDSISFSKNKLTVKYLKVPLMLTLNPTGKDGFSLSAGISAAYRYGAHTKQKSSERGKVKNKGDFDLDPWKFALEADIGYKNSRIFASYSLTPLHDQGLNLTPYSVGLRFSKW